MSPIASPSIRRWLLVGLPCYASWLFANLILLMLFPILLPVELVGGRAGRRFLRAICVLFFRAFFLFHLPALGVYRVVKSGDLKELKSLGPCLVAANHTSWLDGLILFALIPNVRILVGTRYGKVPLVNRPMRWLGCIFVDKDSRDSVTTAVSEMKEALAKGSPVAVFPEGRRSSIGELGPFRDLLFRIAIEARVPVQPVLLHLSLPFLGPGAENFLTAKRADLKIRMQPRLEPGRGERAGDLAFRARREMKRALVLLDETKGE